MTFQEAQQYIASFINFEQYPAPQNCSVFKLERIRFLLDLLGNPQNNLNIIHVAGSKGKGSTCALISSVLCKAGHRVGLYTSPHLNNYRERIRVLEPHNPGRVNSVDVFFDAIQESELCNMLEIMQPHIAILHNQALGQLSFFELFTALAFYYFHSKKTDWVVLETGMGGRLDATNVAPSKVCVITPISLEHTQYLGNTIEEIAKEKAAIIKDSGQKVVIALQEQPALDVFKKRCEQFFIEPKLVGRDINYEILKEGILVPCYLKENLGNTALGQTVRIKGTRKQYDDMELSLVGQHQAMNAAAAVAVVEALEEIGWSIPPAAIYDGFRQAFWPGRLEMFNRSFIIVLDCAHNQASARHLAQSIKKIFPDKKVTLILGVSQDKDRLGICNELNKIVSKVIFTKANHPRAHDFLATELGVLFPEKSHRKADNIEQSLKIAYSEAAPEDVLLITGSVFLVGEARQYLLTEKK